MTAIALTPRGQQLLVEILPEHFRQMAWLMSPLKESERKTFVRLLSKVLRRAGEHQASPTGRAPSTARAAR
jgi:DNA-binding MarR family transcriptional regulator